MYKQSAEPLKKPKKSAVWLNFLGSMNLAITLLLALSIASIIGTVLQQNQPYTDYVIKFGPFWFEIFQQLGLYDVYSASWFLLILFFLVVSTSTCVYRNAPGMLREMREYRQSIQLETLQKMPNSFSWQLKRSLDEVQQVAQQILPHNGFSARTTVTGSFRLVAGMKGAGSRLGYVLTHVAIVLICIGGLIDGNAILKAKEMLGQIVPETENIPANEVPMISRLGLDNLSFRGSVSVPEGSQSNVLFINYKEGYLVQGLPFSIEVKDFRIEHYASGQPKSFESDLLLHDPRLAEPLEQTISVNHPLIYDGYSIYQASFSDGGSNLELQAWPLSGGDNQQQTLNVTVGDDVQINLAAQPWVLETSDFRLFNINPSQDPAKKFQNVGPSVQFKMRDKTGAAKEFLNYMLPIERAGAYYYLSGVRSSPAEEFRYLYIPMDEAGGLGRFNTFLRLLNDQDVLQKVVAKQGILDQPLPTKDSAQFNQAMLKLVELFMQEGIDGVMSQVDKNVPVEKREEVAQLYVRVLQQILGAVYVEVLADEGVDTSLGIDEKKAAFFDDASAAIGAITRYGSPVYFQLVNFEHKQASGLQIAKAPGKFLVYPGCAMLILGVFLMFYAPQQRLWLRLQETKEGVSIVFAGHSERNGLDFAGQFRQIQAQFERVLTT